MQDNEFNLINDFTKAEITNTGADIKNVSSVLIYKLDKMRNMLGRPIYLLKNGLTTGEHKSDHHRNGTAADFYLHEQDGFVSVRDVVLAAIYSDFRGIGIYYNGTAYSFHVDLRDELTIWNGVKEKQSGKWDYETIRFDPRVK